MKRVVGSIVPAILLALFQSSVSAGQPTFRAATELVSLNVTVTDQHAQPVSGLTEDQFEIFEDGVQQQVKFFAPGDLPLDVAILLDTSSSMTGSIGLVQAAAVKFARALRPIDRASVMSIANSLSVLQPFTGDLPAVEQAIKSATVGGKTTLYASIYTSLKELDKLRREATEPRRQAIVLLTDGQDTASTFTFDDLLNVIRRSAVPIYTIAPRAARATQLAREYLYGEATGQADFELKRISEETGGRSFFPITLFELTGVYDDIARELSHQYSLGYQSSNPARGTGFHRIALRVLVPGLKWRARAGYLADTASSRALGH